MLVAAHASGSGQRSLGCRAGYLDFEALDFAKDSAPVIQGQRTITVTSDDLTFAQSTASTASSLATTVLPISLLRSFALSAAPAVIPPLCLSVARRCRRLASI